MTLGLISMTIWSNNKVYCQLPKLSLVLWVCCIFVTPYAPCMSTPLLLTRNISSITSVTPHMVVWVL